jgi:hypothetical protein
MYPTPDALIEAHVKGAGLIAANRVLALGRRAGFDEHTMLAAHDRLGIEAFRGSRGYWWRWPRNPPQARVVAQTAIRANADKHAANVLPIIREAQRHGENKYLGGD